MIASSTICPFMSTASTRWKYFSARSFHCAAAVVSSCTLTPQLPYGSWTTWAVATEEERVNSVGPTRSRGYCVVVGVALGKRATASGFARSSAGVVEGIDARAGSGAIKGVVKLGRLEPG